MSALACLCGSGHACRPPSEVAALDTANDTARDPAACLCGSGHACRPPSEVAALDKANDTARDPAEKKA
eukprot:832887-Pelagomonas_calceolata.AAC.5